MNKIDASLVKQLRDMSSAGFMDAKKALESCDGDIDKAMHFLKQKGIASATKKSVRDALDGFIGIRADGKRGTILELRSETDFVARNKKFLQLLTKLLDTLFVNRAILSDSMLVDGKPLKEVVTESIALLGENIVPVRAEHIEIENGFIATYLHNKMLDNAGKIGVLVALKSDAEPKKLAEIGKQIAMHIAASTPEALDISSLKKDRVDKAFGIFKEQAAASGKPEKIAEKIAQGRLDKFYQEVILLCQPFVINPKITVEGFLEEKSQELGIDIKISKYIKFQLGETLNA